MSAPAVAQKRKWYRLCVRNMRIASRLLPAGFSDAAFFHCCHAYECALCALIAYSGSPVPPEGSTKASKGSALVYQSPGGQTETSVHKARVMLFDELSNKSHPYYSIHQQLKRTLSMQARNTALYYDPKLDRLPQRAYKTKDAQQALQQVRAFARALWSDIK